MSPVNHNSALNRKTGVCVGAKTRSSIFFVVSDHAFPKLSQCSRLVSFLRTLKQWELSHVCVSPLLSSGNSFLSCPLRLPPLENLSKCPDMDSLHFTPPLHPCGFTAQTPVCLLMYHRALTRGRLTIGTQVNVK